MLNTNFHAATIQVSRNDKPVTVEVEGDVDGDIVAINKVISEGKPFIMDDNEFNAARCTILNKLYPKQGWDVKARRLLRIAKEFPGV